MANIAFSTLLPDMQVFVHGCPQPVLINALRLAAIQFCRDSESYKYRPAVQTVTVSVPSYTFTLPTDSEIHGYADVKYVGNSIKFDDWDNVTVRDPAYPTIEGTPANFTYQQDLGTLYLVPVPDVTTTSALLVSLILKPTITAAGLDSVLMDRYKETIVSGAVQRVSIMDKEVWADPKKALLHGNLFRRGVMDAYSEAKTDFGAKAHRVEIRKFR